MAGRAGPAGAPPGPRRRPASAVHGDLLREAKDLRYAQRWFEAAQATGTFLAD